MATKKPTSAPKADHEAARAAHDLTQSYKAAVQRFTKAVELLGSGEFGKARDEFERIEADFPEEPVLGERARTYAAVCRHKSSPETAEPQTDEERYNTAVMLSNRGECDAAIQLLDKALQEMPSSGKLLYARASAQALKGNAEAAVSDLRQAIAADPPIRFQAVNDSDFEQIREEPAFIDIIEPTPTGA